MSLYTPLPYNLIQVISSSFPLTQNELYSIANCYYYIIPTECDQFYYAMLVSYLFLLYNRTYMVSGIIELIELLTVSII